MFLTKEIKVWYSLIGRQRQYIIWYTTGCFYSGFKFLICVSAHFCVMVVGLCIRLCVCERVWMHMEVRNPCLSVFLSHSCVLRQGLSLHLELNDWPGLLVSLPSCLLPSLEIRVTRCQVQGVSGGISLGVLCCAVRTPLTDPSLQPPESSFFPTLKTEQLVSLWLHIQVLPHSDLYGSLVGKKVSLAL